MFECTEAITLLMMALALAICALLIGRQADRALDEARRIAAEIRRETGASNE